MIEAAKRLSELKVDIAHYECAGYNDLILFTKGITQQIKNVYSSYSIDDKFFGYFIDDVILQNVDIAENFVEKTEQMEGKTEFRARSVKYHLNFIIDSYMYALAYQHNRIVKRQTK